MITSQQQVMQIAEIVVTPTTLHTPVGPIDRYRAHWTLGGAVPVSQSTPLWAEILAFILVLCTGFLSLLFLLVKDTDMWSSTLIVTDGRTTYTTMVYTRSTNEYVKIRDAITWASRPPPPGQTGQFALPGVTL